MPQLKFTVSPVGAVTIDAEGYQGTSCQEATLVFEQALGNVSDRQHKGGDVPVTDYESEQGAGW